MGKRVNRMTEDSMKQIFAYAVALDQSGRLRNTIYAKDSTVFVLNSDNTVLLRFDTHQQLPLDDEVRFKASDYEGDKFSIEDGKMVFVTKCGGVERRKSCALPELTLDDVNDIFESHKPGKNANTLVLGKDVVSVLDENLSHVEISGDLKTGWVIVQRDIYSGAKVEVRQVRGHGMGVGDASDIQGTFGPIGLRTSDFIALYSFNASVAFTFFSNRSYCLVSADTSLYDMTGIVAQCVYDELGEIGTTLPVENKEEKKTASRRTK